MQIITIWGQFYEVNSKIRNNTGEDVVLLWRVSSKGLAEEVALKLGPEGGGD